VLSHVCLFVLIINVNIGILLITLSLKHCHYVTAQTVQTSKLQEPSKLSQSAIIGIAIGATGELMNVCVTISIRLGISISVLCYNNYQLTTTSVVINTTLSTRPFFHNNVLLFPLCVLPVVCQSLLFTSCVVYIELAVLPSISNDLTYTV